MSLRKKRSYTARIVLGHLIILSSKNKLIISKKYLQTFHKIKELNNRPEQMLEYLKRLYTCFSFDSGRSQFIQ